MPNRPDTQTRKEREDKADVVAGLAATARHNAFALLSLMIAVALVGFVMLQYSAQIRDVSFERKGCERLDSVRSGLYELEGLVIEASSARLQVETDPELRRVTRANRDRYIAAQTALVESVGDFSVDGGIHIDCARAYPYPWPLG